MSRPSYHCIRVSDEVFERLLQRDPNADVAVAKLVFTNLELDDPLEAANVLGYLSNRTFGALRWSTNIKTIRELLDYTNDEIALFKGIGKKGVDESQALRRHFRYNLRVNRVEAIHE